MEDQARKLTLICRRLRTLRLEAVRQSIEGRESMLREAAGPLKDRDKIDRDVSLRLLRATGNKGAEGN